MECYFDPPFPVVSMVDHSLGATVRLLLPFGLEVNVFTV
jgi:hypothetical protein